MKIKHLTFLAIATATSLLSCKKNNEDHLTPPSASPSVYVTGSNASGYAYWKNGQLISSPVKTANMVVYNGDVYLPNQRGYLKNNIQVNLPHATIITGIAVNGSDVYAIGGCDTLHTTTFYWKNSELVMIPDNTDANGAGFIGVSNNNVFVSGSKRYPWYWKNDTFHVAAERPILQGTSVSGSDIYQYGLTLDAVTAYWKNGVINGLTLPHQDSLNWINDVFASGDDVYIVANGSGSDWPLYWKNGQPMEVGLLGDNVTIPVAIAVDAGNVYVVGNQKVVTNGVITYNAFIWKNGIKDTIGLNTTVDNVLISR